MMPKGKPSKGTPADKRLKRNKGKRRAKAALAVMALLSPILVAVAPSAVAAPPCVGTWTVGVGGMVAAQQDSRYFNVNQPVSYYGLNAWAGLDELTRLVGDHLAACPGDDIIAIGHSQGAGIVHVFAQRHPELAGKASAVLLADPRRLGPPGGNGMGTIIPGFHPLTGVDADFGGWPTLTICNERDGVCNLPGGAFVGNPSHTDYNMNVHAYPKRANGHVFIPGK